VKRFDGIGQSAGIEAAQGLQLVGAKRGIHGVRWLWSAGRGLLVAGDSVSSE